MILPVEGFGPASSAVDAENPWPGLATYEERWHDFFYGRARETRELFRFVEQGRVTVLYGRSGLGKSSLVNAGLFRELRVEGRRYLPVPITLRFGSSETDAQRQHAYVVQSVKDQIALALEAGGVDARPPKPEETLYEYFHREDVDFWDARNRPLTMVLVFDQFEEIFTLGQASEAIRGATSYFLQEFAALAEDTHTPPVLERFARDPAAKAACDFDKNNYKILINLREDFLPHLADRQDVLPSILRRTLRLEEMTADQAMEVILKPGGSLVAPGVAERIIDFVASPNRAAPGLLASRSRTSVDPAILCLVCRQLNEERKQREKETGQPALIETSQLEESEAGKIIENYYDDSLAARPALQKFVESELVRDGLRLLVPESSAVNRHRIDPADIDDAVRKHRVLVREMEQGVPWLKLSHDRLAEVAGRRSAEREIEERRRQLKRSQRIFTRLIALFSFLVVVGIVAALIAWREAGMAQRELAKNIEQHAAAQVQEAKLVWLSAAKQAVHAGLYPQSAFYAARALGFRGYGWENLPPDQQAAFDQAYPPLFDPAQHPELYRDLKSQLALGTISYLPVWISPFSKKAHAGPVTCLAYSPDGKILASGSDDTTIKLWDVAGGQTVAVLSGHAGSVRTLRWSADGQTLASGSDDKTIKLWDVASKACRATWTGHTGAVLDLAWSPDGKTIASASRDATIRLWNVATGQVNETLTGHVGAVTSVAFSSTGEMLASGGDDKTVRFWSAATGRLIETNPGSAAVTSLSWDHHRELLAVSRDDKTIQMNYVGKGTVLLLWIGAPWPAHTARIEKVSWSRDGQTLASASDDDMVKLWDAAGHLRATLPDHGETVLALDWSPDGKTLASGGVDREIKFWNAATGERVNAPPGHAYSIRGIAWSPDGRTVASASWDATVRLWDMASGQCRATLRGHLDYVWAVAWSPDSTQLATASADHTVKLWDAATGRCLATLTGHTMPVIGVAWSPDGRTIASGSDDHNVRLWDVVTHQSRVLTGHTNTVLCLAFSPDGKTVASSSKDRTVRLWDVATGAPVAVLTGHTDEIWRVCWSPDGRSLASSARDHTIRLWDAQTHLTKTVLTGHTDWVQALGWSPDGQFLASGSHDKTIKIWSLATNTCEATLTGHTDAIFALGWSPDSHSVASAGMDEAVRVWDVAPFRPQATLTGHADIVWATPWSPDGKTLATASADRTIKLWDVATGQCRATLTGHTDAVLTVAWSPDGRMLASGSDDHDARLWDVATGRCLATLKGHTIPVMTVAFSPDGRTLATGSKDVSIKLWDPVSFQCVATLIGHSGTILSLGWSPDGKTLASGSMDRTIKLWDVAGRLCRETLSEPGVADYVRTIAWSPDGKTIASGDQGNAVRLWDVAAGRCVQTWVEHTDQIASVTWSPDGQTVASGSWDRTIKLWNVATGQCVATLTGHADSVLGVSWSPDGRTLASSSRDRTIKLWDLTQIQPRKIDLASYLANGWYRFNPGTDEVQAIQSGPANLYQAHGMTWTNLNPRSAQTLGPK